MFLRLVFVQGFYCFMVFHLLFCSCFSTMLLLYRFDGFSFGLFEGFILLSLLGGFRRFFHEFVLGFILVWLPMVFGWVF